MKALLRGAANALATAVLALYGCWARIRGPWGRAPLPSQVRRALVIRLDLMGDVVFSVPAIEALAAAFPRARVDALVLPYTAPLLDWVPAVNKVHQLDVNAYRRPAGWLRVGTLLAVLLALRQQRYDVAIGLSGRMGGVFAVASGARWRVGYARETYPGCYNLPVPGRRYRRPLRPET